MADSILRLKVESQEYDNKLKQATNGLTRYVDECRKVGGTLEVVEKETLDYVRALGQMDTTSRTATGKLAEMKKTFTELSAQYKQMTDAEKQSPFGKALAASLDQLKGRIGESKEQLDDINKSINGGGGLTGAIDSLSEKFGMSVQSLAGWGTALAAGKAALDVAKDAFFKNEEQLDTWGRVVEASQSLYSGFLDALNTGDISGYLDRIGEITRAAQNAYNALDALSTFNAFNQVNVEKTRTGMTESIADYRSGQGTKEQVKAAGEAYQKELRERQKLEKQAYLDAIKKVAAERGVNGQDLITALSGSYGSYESLKAIPMSGSRTKFTPGGMFGGSTAYEEAYPVNRQEQLGAALRKLNDTELQSLQALGAQAERTGNEIAQVDKQLTRVLNGRQPGASSGGSGGKGGKITPAYIPLDGSIDDQTKKVQELQKAWRAAADDDSRKKIKEQIEQAQLVLDVMNGKTKLADITIKADTSEALEKLKGIEGITIDPKDVTIKADTSEALEKLKGIEGITIDPKDVTIKADTSEALAKIQDIKNIDISISSHSLPGLENELKELNEQRKLLSDPIEIELIDNQIKEVKDEIDRLNGKKVEIEIMPSTMTPFEQLKQSLTIQLAEENIQIDETTLKTLMQTAIQNGIDGLDPQFASLQEKMREGMNIPDSAWEDLQTQINEKLKELDIEPIKIDFKTGNLAKDGKETEKSWQAAAQAVQSVGGAMQSIEDPAAKVAGTIAQAIASIALGYAQATTQAATLGPWAWVAFAATGMAQMISMISGIHNATGYAEGGIIKGNSYSGDNIMANGGTIGLNAGELVLTRAQQSTLASELQNGGNRIQVVGRLSGEQLFLCAENWSKRTGKGEFVTW